MSALPPSAAEVFDALLLEILAIDASADRERMRRAFDVCVRLYEGETHWAGMPLQEHVLGVLRTLLAFEPDEDAVIGCLLQHALAVKASTLEDIEREFGPAVRSIVGGCHLLAHVTSRNKRMAMEHLRLMFLRISDDPRVVLIVLCTQRFQMERVESLPADERRRFSRDALHIFAPVAARLGIYTLKHQFERAAFPQVYPTDSARIVEQMDEMHRRYGDFLELAASALVRYLRDEGVSARVDVREKQPYSIFRKMQEKSVTHVEDLYDLFAIRVIVRTEMECYQVLGLLHRIGHPIVNRFKDFIAFPKPNGYQSLHTTLAHLPGSPDWVFVEVQVRTEAMHREAEYGIAAHWSYKEGGTAEMAANRVHLQKVLQYQQSEAAGRMMDHIFVLTPRGDVVELPEGATPLDFAFQLHTDLGLTFRAARVNGSIVPLDHTLENGDIVEVLKHKDPRPSARWMTLLKTASAKSRLRRYLAAQDRPAHVAAGREMVDAELHERGLAPLDHDLSVLRRIDGKTLTFSEREDLLAQVAQGGMRISALLQQAEASPARPVRKTTSRPPRPASSVQPRVVGAPMPMRNAKCCKQPLVPGEPLTGIIGRDGKVRVHRTACKMLKGANPGRRVEVRWE